MALNQEMGRPPRDGSEHDFIVRPIPFLVGLWRQLGADTVIKRPASEEPELFAALQSEIIPRLMIASRLPDSHLTLVRTAPDSEQATFSAPERHAFVTALLSDDATLPGDLADAYLAHGRAPETILLELFAWSARELGELWSDDQVSFVDVTIGLCRLHEALHRISEQSDPPAKTESAEAPSILIAIAPGEQHVFGVLMAGELFRKQGWTVTTDTSGDAATITSLMASRRFDMAGLSVSHDGVTQGLPQLVRAMRKASRNPELKLVLGGNLVEQSPGIAREIGADGIAGRGLDAPELARKMLAN
ncbi:MAG: B12-binding domain-containing protein [Hyphomonas sp.]